MIYLFACHDCGIAEEREARAFHPPRPRRCPTCNEPMSQVFNCNIDTSMCKDHDDIPHAKRVSRGAGMSAAAAQREEVKFQRHISKRRKDLADGGNRGGFRHTNSVPADLYHGKISETGDRSYWEDPRNLKKHSNTKVD